MLEPGPVNRRATPALAVVYGSTYGNTANAAERVAACLEARLKVPVPCLDVGAVPLAQLRAYGVWIAGVSTWNVGELQADWDVRIDEVAALDLRGTRVALFGAGDAAGYPDTFGDAVGLLADRLEAAGAMLFGALPVEACPVAFEATLAQRGEDLVGLLLDYDDPDTEVEPLLESWCEQLVGELADAIDLGHGRAPLTAAS